MYYITDFYRFFCFIYPVEHNVCADNLFTQISIPSNCPLRANASISSAKML